MIADPVRMGKARIIATETEGSAIVAIPALSRTPHSRKIKAATFAI